jgi:hypothetical protein
MWNLASYNVTWNTPSRDSSGSIPLGNGDLRFYIAKF